jgi:alcohol dehydrogenase class IV
MRGAEIYEAEECSGIVAVGGGSPMDCAKGIGIVSSNKQNILSFEGVDEVRVPGPPLICIPTTAGSAADVSQFAIINDEMEKRKIAIISKALVPDISLLDPLPLLTLPRDVTVNCGMDVLSHAIEAYVSNASSPVTDLHARKAIDLIARSLPVAVEHPDNIDARFATMMASLHAGLAFSNASLGAVHALAHALGGYLNLSHGLANALLLESVVAFNYSAATARYDEIGRIMQVPEGGGKEALVSGIRAFRSSLGIVGTIADAGCELPDISSLAVRAIADPCLATNPKNVILEDIGMIYEAAF